MTRPPKGSDWSVKLTRSLTLRDGTELITLADARAAMRKYLAPEVEDGALGRALSLLLTAAKAGSLANREAATDQVESVLRWRRAMY
jgi:hypothetical protein